MMWSARARRSGLVFPGRGSLSPSPVSGCETAPCDAPMVGAAGGLAEGDVMPKGDGPTLGREKSLLLRSGREKGRREKSGRF